MKSLLIAGCFALSVSTAAQTTVTADLVLLHGHVWTGAASQPDAEAIAVIGERVIAVGKSDDIAKLAGPATRVIDLHGRLAAPGFNDAHVHFFAGGQSLAGVQLLSSRSPQEMRDRIAAFAKTIPANEWILDGNWDHENWSPADLPTHQMIDAATPQNPVFVSRFDGHMALANAVAMRLAGVDRNTPDVPGGVIERDANGEPTGIFKDAALQLIFAVVPAPTPAQLMRALHAAEQYAMENGVTSVQQMWGGEPQPQFAAELRILHAEERAGTLETRVSLHDGLPYYQTLAQDGVTAAFGSAMVRIGGLKEFADGSLGSRTAWMLAPYADGQTSGIAREILLHPDQTLAEIRAADQAGMQIAIHAIGDRANREVLNLYEQAEKQDGPRDRRFRIEHAQILDPSDIPRFGALHVIASMQPGQLPDDGRWTVQRIGAERVKHTYAFRSLLDSGAVLAFGSDWPVAPMKPLEGIYAAVTRRTTDGKNPGGWTPSEKITAAEALRAYTTGAAYAEFQERDKGTLEKGKLADIVVVDMDLLSATPDALAKAHVDMTILAGKVIFERKQ